MGAIAWVTTMSSWLTLSTTTFLMTSHVSLLWLLRLYKYEQIHPATWYIILLVLLAGPHLVNLIYLLWKTPIVSAAHREKFPGVSGVILGVITGLLEGVSTSVFACEAAHYLPEPVLLTLPSATLALVIVLDIYRYNKESLEIKGQSGSSFILFKFIQCVHVISVGYMMFAGWAVAGLLCDWSTFGLTKEGCTIIVVVLILLAAVWLPSVQKLLHKRNSTDRPSSVIDLVYVVIKVIAICFTLYLSIFFKLDEFRNFPWPCFTYGLFELSRYNIWFPVVTCMFGGAMSSLNVWASFKVGLSAPGVTIPFILCVPLSMIITAYLWNDFETGAFWELTSPDIFAWLAIVLSVISWLAPFVLPAVTGFKTQPSRSKSMYKEMAEFTWDTFFLEPKLLLVNYRERELYSATHDMYRTSDSTNRVSTIFICTTMYKESQVEMLRYLTSIQNVFERSNANQLKLEAHVFFDNSIQSDRLNSRARHLLALTCQTFQVSRSQLIQLTTPYGCQVHTGRLLKYPLFLHFKDEMKVKCKKRWSQVMYFHYMLRFRTTSQYRENGEKLGINPGLRPGDSQTKSGCLTYYPHASRSFISETQMATLETNVESLIHQNCSSTGHASYILNFGSSKEHIGLSYPPLASSTLLHPDYQARDIYMDKREADYTDFTYRKSSFSLSSDKDHSSSIESLSTEMMYNSETDKIFMTQSSTLQLSSSSLDQIFLLTTDADTEFTSESLQSVLNQCQSDPNIAAVCGRTEPVGAMKPIVWYQKFEYAKDFWLVKSSQTVIGSVTCCPGCFSIYRGGAMMTVLSEFCKPTNSAFDNLVMDHGEDRWLCTLLMQRGWRLAYSSTGHNSTHCPETIGEFLRQRRRWVLSELSNTADILMTVAELVRNNSSFSVMFLFSLLSTFLWVILSPATTLVFLCAGFHVLFNVTMTFTLPLTMALFLGYCFLCYVANQNRQKIVSIAMICLLAATVLSLSVGFSIYIINAAKLDMRDMGYIQFRPYFLVFLLIISIVYAAALHPRESLCLMYGFAYALLFPAMFVVLPVYGVANMLDQSWGTRESGSHGCCQVPDEEEDNTKFTNYDIKVSTLEELTSTPGGETEQVFWNNLITTYIGNDVNKGMSSDVLSRDLHHLRALTMSGLILCNFLWFICLSVLYAFAGSDVICYSVAAIFSFSLVVQLIGLTCFKINNLIDRNLKKNVEDYVRKH